MTNVKNKLSNLFEIEDESSVNMLENLDDPEPKLILMLLAILICHVIGFLKESIIICQALINHCIELIMLVVEDAAGVIGGIIGSMIIKYLEILFTLFEYLLHLIDQILS